MARFFTGLGNDGRDGCWQYIVLSSAQQVGELAEGDSRHGGNQTNIQGYGAWDRAHCSTCRRSYTSSPGTHTAQAGRDQ
jgi:hypothetical protein